MTGALLGPEDWRSFTLTQSVDRYGFFGGTVLTRESVGFEEGMTLILGKPLFFGKGEERRIIVQVNRFDRRAKTPSGREWMVCLAPTYVIASELGDTLKVAASKRIGKDNKYPNAT